MWFSSLTVSRDDVQGEVGDTKPSFHCAPTGTVVGFVFVFPLGIFLKDPNWGFDFLAFPPEHPT